MHRVLHRHLGRLSHSFDVAVGVGHDYVLDDASVGTIYDLLHGRTSALWSTRADDPDAGLGTGAELVLAVSMDIWISDHRIGRPNYSDGTIRRCACPDRLGVVRHAVGEGRVEAWNSEIFGGRRMMTDKSVADETSSFRSARAPRLAWSFFRIGAMNELQYRSNFFLQLLESFLTLAAGLVGLAVVFGRTANLNGWTRPELLVVMGVFTMVGGITNTFVVPNMQKLVEDIQRGTLDYALTKPADAQTLISVRLISIWQSVDILTGLIVLIIGMVQLEDNSNGITGAASLVLLLVLGCWTIYCFWLILASTAFWFIRVNEMQELFQGLFRSGQYPVRIYPGWMRFGLTFLVPIGFAITVPAEAATGRLTGATVLVAIAAAAIFGIGSRLIWRSGLKHYSGASA